MRVVLTLATLAAAVSCSITKSWKAVRSGATHFEQEVGLARQHVALAHQRPGQHPVLEGAQVGLRLAVQADHGEGDHLEADHLLVELGEVAGDHAGLLQRAHAAQAGRRRDADLLGQLHVGDAAVGLQLLENAPIGSIEAGAHGGRTPRARGSASLAYGANLSNFVSRGRQKIVAAARGWMETMADALQAVAGRRGWIISDGKAGHEAQARGVAEALGLAVEIKRVAPADAVEPAVAVGAGGAVGAVRQRGEPVSSAVARFRVRHRPADHSLHPPPEADGGAGHLHGDPARPEGVAEHGRPVLGARARQAARAQCHHHADGAAHLLGQRAWPSCAAGCRPEIAALPSPRVAVLLGGPNGDYRYTPPRVAHLASALQSLGALGAGLMITASRRTPADVVAFLREQTAWQPHLFWDGEGENPYAQFLAQADAFIVPADSINMTGEPCATGKPIYVFEPEGGSPKFARFHDALRRHGATRPLPARFERLETWSYPPLNSASAIAAEIARRWAKRRQMLGGSGDSAVIPD